MKIEATNTSRMVDYFEEIGLVKVTGISPYRWNLMIFKELMDNALDAMEELEEKRIDIIYRSDDGSLEILDNGNGITEEKIRESIYNFSVYFSNKRNYITPSRGKQGNGLKTIIGVCYVRGYRITWYTAEGHAVKCALDAEGVENGKPPKLTMEHLGQTDKRGIRIEGIWSVLDMFRMIKNYSECNPDVTITYNDGEEYVFKATKQAVNKSNDTHISYYTPETLKKLADTFDGNITYKKFLNSIFPTRIPRESGIRCKLSKVDFKSQQFKDDFEKLHSLEPTKKFTLLRGHKIGLQHNVELTDETGKIYIVEFEVKELEKKREYLQCTVFANNTITYNDAESVLVYGHYQVGSRKNEKYSYSLEDVLQPYSDFEFIFHFICADFEYLDTGKTKFDVSGIMGALSEGITKALRKEHRENKTEIVEKKPSQKVIMREFLTEAYNIASSNGKYHVSARQIFYKLRELSGIEEKKNTYDTFTQDILTEWLDDHPEAEKNVFFADRGKFYCRGIAKGIGTGNVRQFISMDGYSDNCISMNVAESTFNLYLDFNVRYKYDKVLFIEKTGFDGIFEAEHISEKYNMIIVSGQGFSTRSAKELLYYLYSQGLTIFCMHDYDYSGINIINSLRKANKKFKYSIPTYDLGITMSDIEKYGITPEIVKRGKQKKIKEEKYTPEQQEFFFPDSKHHRRVEINAFTTEQVLEILDSKLRYYDNLPKVDIADVISFNHDVIKERALQNVILKKYGSMLKGIKIDYSPEHEMMTVNEAEHVADTIVEDIISAYEMEISKNLTKIL